MNFQSNTGRKSHLSLPRTYTKGGCVNGIYRNVPQGYQMANPLRGICWNLSTILKKKEWLSVVWKLGTHKVTSTAQRFPTVTNFYRCHGGEVEEATRPPSILGCRLSEVPAESHTSGPAPQPQQNLTGELFESKPEMSQFESPLKQTLKWKINMKAFH